MTAEIERLIADARSDAGLQAALRQQRGSLEALIRLANERGYKIGRADAEAYLAAQSSELNDDQLDHVAAGERKQKSDSDQFGMPDWLKQFRATHPR